MNCQASNEHIIRQLAHRQGCFDSGYAVGPAWEMMQSIKNDIKNAFLVPSLFNAEITRNTYEELRAERKALEWFKLANYPQA